MTAPAPVLMTGGLTLPPGEALMLERMWDDDIWEELLAYIEERRVVPVIGADLMRVDTGEGRVIPLERHIAEELAAKLGIARDEIPAAPRLNDVVCVHLRRGGRRESLYPKIRGIAQASAFEAPPALVKLASITDLKLFVTTTFDTLLETALNGARFAGAETTQSLGYSPNNVRDIEVGQRTSEVPLVYHLLGTLSASPSYVISDEDLLEFICALQTDERHLPRLFDELENNHLLFLGGTFPDWLSRLLLRTTKGRRLSDPRVVVEILADNHTRSDRDLVSFLGNYSTRTKVFTSDANAFVDELWRRWSERSGAGPIGTAAEVAPSAEMPDGAIFISYAREDLAAVRVLKAGLEAAGLPVWFDFDRLGVGDSYDLKIQKNIRRCSLFLPVLSRNTDRRVEGFFRREWGYALDRDKNFDDSTAFIMPVVVDGTAADLKRIPPRFCDLHIEPLAGGEPHPRFVADLRAAVAR